MLERGDGLKHGLDVGLKRTDLLAVGCIQVAVLNDCQLGQGKQHLHGEQSQEHEQRHGFVLREVRALPDRDSSHEVLREDCWLPA